MDPSPNDQQPDLAFLTHSLQQCSFNSLDAIESLNQAIITCLQHILTGSLRISDFIRAVKEKVPEDASSWISNGILSSLWIVASQNKVLLHQNVETVTDHATSSSLTALLKDLISSDLVDATALKSTMELSSLVDGGLLKEEEQTIQKRIIKLNTGLVYKQQKYNLLREETEGYSKLMLVLNNVSYSTSSQANATNSRDANNLKMYTESILGIIGQFDLDPNRVFDIILDAFELQPLNIAFIDILRALRPTNLAHTLGFKFLQYSDAKVLSPEKAVPTPAPSKILSGSKSNVDMKSGASNTTEETSTTSLLETIQTPYALLEVAAMLIIGNLVQLEDLVPYLHPAIEDTKEFLEASKTALDQLITSTKLDVKTSKGVVAMKSILASNIDIEKVSKVQKNQLIGLLAALIRLHGWEDAHCLLSKIGMSMETIIGCIEPVRKATISLFTWCMDGMREHHGLQALLTDPDYHSRARGTAVVHISNKQIEQLKSLDTFIDVCWEWIWLLKHHIVEDLKLFSKLCRLLKAIVQTNRTTSLFPDADTDHQKNNKLFQVLLFLLQGLSVSGNDSTYVSAQVWQVLSLLSFQDRFALYEVWKEGGFLRDGQKCPAMINLIDSFALSFCRSQMKRLAKENAKQIGQKLSKFMHASPIIFIQHVLSQIENFDNLIPYIVEAMKYSTDLSRDVFAACILLQLKRTELGTKIKAGDTHYVQWFSALSKFISTFYCKYPNTEIKGLFSYLLQSFSNGNASDLLLLKDLLGVMGGCETLLEVSPFQLDGLGGGKVLRTEAMNLSSSVAMSTNKASSNALSTKRSSVVLREELISSGAAMPMLLFIAQIRSNVLYESSNRHLKLISHFYDTAQDLMMQFADFLIAEAKSVDAIAKLMPDFRVLVEEVGLSIPIAFQLVRPLLRHGLQQKPSLEMPSSSISTSKKIWHPFHPNIADMIDTHASADGKLSTRLNIYFWTLSLYDISVPTERYQAEIKTIKTRWADLESKKGTTTAASMQMNQSEFTKWCKQRDADMKLMAQTINALSDELNAQLKHAEKMKEVLASEKEQFFVSRDNGGDCLLSDSLLQALVLKRVLMSPVDAVYCIRFCKLLYDIEVPNFCLFDFFDKFIACILPLLFASTETEAKFIGHALTEVLLLLNPLYTNEERFKLETKGKVISTAALFEIDPETNSRVVSHQHFRSLYQKWHSKVLEIVIFGLNGKEFMYIRSALVLLSKVSLQFPFIKSEGLKLLQRIKKLEADEEEREDLQLMAKSVYIVITRQSFAWFDDMPNVQISQNSTKAATKDSTKDPIKDFTTSKDSTKESATKDSSKEKSKRAPSVSKKSSVEVVKSHSKSNKDTDVIGSKRKALETENAAPPTKIPRSTSNNSSTVETAKSGRNTDVATTGSKQQSQSGPQRAPDSEGHKGAYGGVEKDRSSKNGAGNQSNNAVGGRSLLGNPVTNPNPPNLSTPQYAATSNHSNSNYQSRSNNYHAGSAGGSGGNYNSSYNNHGGSYHNQGHYESSSRYHESMRPDYDSSNYRHPRNDDFPHQNNRMPRSNYSEGQGNSNNMSGNNPNNKRPRK